MTIKDTAYDFARPAPKRCKNCGYPFGGTIDGKKPFPMSWTECPEHMPAWWRKPNEPKTRSDLR
jgi:hypothetical protein